MEPKTKREANEAADALEHQANIVNKRIVNAICAGNRRLADQCRDNERRLLNEAARLRALLPTLPD